MRVFGRVPLDLAQTQAPRGRVYLLPNRCKGCGFCVAFCPKEALLVSAAANGKGYHYPEIAPGKQDACVHCGFCAAVCPEFAIFSEEVPA